MKKQIFLIPVVALGASLASCGGNKKPAVQYGVSLNMTEAMNIDKVTATSNKDYDAKISIKDDFTGYCEMPTKLYEVHVDGVLLEEGEQYTYTRDSDNEARLHIPSKNVNGDIEIYTEAKAEDIKINYKGDKILHDKEKAVVGSSTVIHLSLDKENAKKFSVPDKLTDLSVTCKDAHDGKLYPLTRCCTYEKRDDASAKLTIPAKYNGVVVITGEINIEASCHQPTYTIEEGDDLYFLETDCPLTVNKGEECSFTITASDASHGIPETLDIQVGGMPLSKEDEDYSITPITPSNPESATVKIVAEKVTDNIVVNGSGEKVAPVKYYLGGIIEPTKTSTPVGEPFDCELKVEEGVSSKVTANDIRVRIGDKKDPDAWLIPNSDEASGVKFIEADQKLVIDASWITSSSDEIHIAAKAHSVKLLEFYSSYGDWASIETAANLGYAPWLFEIGEESVPFSIGSDTYRIRIIGFNSDKNYQYGNTAGITFEFTSCVSQQYFGKSVSGKTNSSYFYKSTTAGVPTYQSELYDYLNTTLLDALPFKKYINSVSKFTVAGSYDQAVTDGMNEKAVESPNYLFPLSLKELKLESTISGEFSLEGTGEKHDSTYEYYKKANQSLIKTYGGEAVTYWLRSPANVKQPQIYTINADGKRASAPARGQKLYVAPAFCF